MFLEIKDLTKIYGEKRAVDRASFSMEKGELICVLGPSGCGKTTLLRGIGGFIKTDEGEILLNGKNINNRLPEERPVATVFQSYGLFPHMTVMENVIYGLKFKGVKRDQWEKKGLDILRLVNLDDYGPKRVQQLSGGEQQRVALARSLIVEPELLLLDEPLSNLDAKLRVVMRKEIKEIQKRSHVSTIFVTHDQEDAFAIADRIILMEKGKIIQIDRADEVYNNPNSLFSLDFIGDSSLNLREDQPKYLRPEDVVIEDLAEEGNGLVVEKTFKGSTILYQVQVGEGEVLKALSLNRGRIYNEGDRVRVSYIYKRLGGN